MKLNYVETIIAMAEAGSIRGAAARLGKSQPTLTSLLRQMEQELGVTLFHRTPRGVRPTAIGSTVIQRARSVALEVGRLEDEVAQYKGQQTGTLRACVSPLGAIQILPRALKLFERRYPHVKVIVSSGLFPKALEDLRKGHTDIVIGPEPAREEIGDIRTDPLFETKVVLFTRAGTEAARAKSLAGLQSCNWVTLGEPGGPGDIIEDLFRKNGLTPPVPKFTSEDYFGAVAMVLELGAVSTFPEKLLKQLDIEGKVKVIDVPEDLPVSRISLFTRGQSGLTPAAQELVSRILRRASALSKASA